VILVNKWDLVEKETMSTRDYEKKIREELMPFTMCLFFFVSALTKQRLLKALEATLKFSKVDNSTTSKFNEYMLKVIEAIHHLQQGKYVKIKYCMQLPTKTPQFVFFANMPYVKGTVQTLP
jgi:GTP-binding protein